MTCEASEEETFYGSTMGRRRGLVHISCELFLACVFVSSRDAPTLAITSRETRMHRNKSSHAVHTLIGSHTTDASETGGPVGLFANPMQRRPL